MLPASSNKYFTKMADTIIDISSESTDSIVSSGETTAESIEEETEESAEKTTDESAEESIEESVVEAIEVSGESDLVCKYCLQTKTELADTALLLPCCCTNPVCQICLQKHLTNRTEENMRCEICRIIFDKDIVANLIELEPTTRPEPRARRRHSKRSKPCCHRDCFRGDRCWFMCIFCVICGFVTVFILSYFLF